MRTIFIWDIHGCFDEFMALLDKINFDYEKDKLYLTGDLINKGPKAFEVVDFLLKHPKILSVKWNNELNFLRFLENDMRKYNPVFDVYKQQFKPEHIEYLKNLPLWIETDEWLLVHGWLIPGKTLEEHTEDEITRIRMYNWKPWYEYYNKGKVVIYWHWAADGLRIRKFTKGLDSGCVYGKRLTAYIWENWEIIQQSAFKQYVSVE